jgi:hypothetical protein
MIELLGVLGPHVLRPSLDGGGFRRGSLFVGAQRLKLRRHGVELAGERIFTSPRRLQLGLEHDTLDIGERKARRHLLVRRQGFPQRSARSLVRFLERRVFLVILLLDFHELMPVAYVGDELRVLFSCPNDQTIACAQGFEY